MLHEPRKLDDLRARSAAILHALGGVVEAGKERVQPKSSWRRTSAVDVHQTIAQFKNAWLFADKRSPASIHALPSPIRRLGCGSGNLKHGLINGFNNSFVENLIGSSRPSSAGRNSRVRVCPELCAHPHLLAMALE